MCISLVRVRDFARLQIADTGVKFVYSREFDVEIFYY
jgi:hypothetical protein